jgi:hypothetical protein
MSPLIILAFGIILLAVVIYVILYVIIPSASYTDVLTKQVDLSKELSVLSSSDVRQTLYGGSGSTIMTFINPIIGDRTPKFTNTYLPILSIDDTFYFEISPSPLEKSSTVARMRIATSNTPNNKYETIDLPQLPLQKWTLLSILRDGRRFDVMYDDKIVMSHRLQFYPLVPSNAMKLGNSGLIGRAVHFLVADKRLTPSEVTTQYTKLADTNGAPIVNRSLPFFGKLENISIPKLSVSVPGLDIAPIVDNPPPNTMKAWRTPYA